MASANLSALRIKYLERKDLLLEENIKVKEPFSLFAEWFNAAVKCEEIMEPNAVTLATVNKNGCPSNRFVLMKSFNTNGFTFFTNYDSHKAHDIAANPNVAMTIYWCPLRRQVRIEGTAKKIPESESREYFYQRPRASQIGACISKQSTRLESRKNLDEQEAKLKESLGPDGQVPVPNWGGYLITPNLIEFWQGQTDRLHDRIVFRRGEGVEKEVDGKFVHQGDNGWVYERLAP